jgi:MFS family permease
VIKILTGSDYNSLSIKLFIFSFLQGLTNGIWGFLSIYLLNLGGSSLELGVLSTVPGLANTFMQLAWGRVSDRMGRSWRMVTTGFLLSALFSVPVIMSQEPWQIIAASGFQAFFGSISGVALTVRLADALEPSKRARFMGVYNPMGFAGNITGSFLTGLLIPLLGYRYTLFGYTIVSLVIVALIRFGFQDITEDSFNYLGLLKDSLEELGKGLRELRGLMRREGTYTKWCLGMSVRGWGLAMFGPVSTILLVRSLNATELQIGSLNSLTFSLRLIASPLLGWVADRKGVKYIMLSGFVLAICYPIVFSIASNVTHLIPVYILGGIFWACINSAWFAWQMNLIPKERGTYVGLFSFINGMSWAVGPIVGGILGDTIGAGATATFSSFFILIGLLILLRVPERSKGHMS